LPRNDEMRTRSVILVIVAAIAGIGLLCFLASFASQRQAAHEAELDRRRQPIMQVLHQQEAFGRSQHVVYHDYAQEIAGIDASKCPEDFRLAWENYVSTVRQNDGPAPKAAELEHARKQYEDVARQYQIAFKRQ
jgi:hypothetical protein